MNKITYTVEVDEHGTKFWYLNDKRHRTDGPAEEWADGTKRWYQNDKRHRTDGPAVEYSNGTKEWYLNGKLHRTDGPAIEYADGSKFWYVDDERLTEVQWCQRVKALKTPCADKVVEVEGVRYKLVAL